MKLNGQSFDFVSIVDDDGHLQRFETKELFKINKSKIQEELLKFTSEFAWWNRLKSELFAQKNQAKRALEVTEAELSLKARRGGYGDIKITEGTITNLVNSDPVMNEKHQIYNDLSRLSDIAFSTVESLRMKQEMIKLYLSELKNYSTSI